MKMPECQWLWHFFFARTSYTDDGEWKNAEDVYAGEKIRSSDGSYGTVTSTRVIRDVNQAMYNLTVEEAHTFFVGEGQWLVHNICESMDDVVNRFSQNTGEFIDDTLMWEGQPYSIAGTSTLEGNTLTIDGFFLFPGAEFEVNPWVAFRMRRAAINVANQRGIRIHILGQNMRGNPVDVWLP